MKQTHSGLLHNKAWLLVDFWINFSWNLLAQKLYLQQIQKRWIQKSIILPQIKLCNDNPVNPTEYKNNKEMKTKQTAQIQKVWQELSVL